MVDKHLSKIEAKEKIETFFFDIKNKPAKEISKIQKLAMNKRISLKNYKQSFCKKCLKPYLNPKIRIKSGNKIITCENCGFIKRIKL